MISFIMFINIASLLATYKRNIFMQLSGFCILVDFKIKKKCKKRVSGSRSALQ